MWGITTVECLECSKIRKLYGWLPMTQQIWNQNEGLLCCGVQTKLINFEEGEEE